MFQAALDSIQPNFTPGILQTDPKFSNKYFNMSNGQEFAGPWNQGSSMETEKEWQYIKHPHQHVLDTNGLLDEVVEGTERTEDSVQANNQALSAERKAEIDTATMPTNGAMSWSVYNSQPDVAEQLPGKFKANAKSKK